MISSLLPSAPSGSSFCKSPSGSVLSVFGPLGWSTDLPFNPGEAGFLTPSAPMQITFCGSVLQGCVTNLLPQGLCAVSSMAPISGYLSSQMGFPACPGDVVGLCSSNGTSYFQFNSSWSPGEPYLPAGQGFLFMSGDTPPPAPVPISPQGGGFGTMPAFTFTTVAGAAGYQVYLYDGTTSSCGNWFTPAQVDPSNTGTGTITLPG